ncbi:uncharacterized protein UBRO_20341 [Ustilago bromivora]|uniref:CCHC-type domain-containing protein n=1 Tax=Ustilago bromivora TaxID=307758 RepID=A0A1K0HG59_9BASI|nr:uncharacterized protein UBRO_20341 [Ustilago bromivora]
MIEEPLTPTLAPRPGRSVSFLDQSKQSYSTYEKYALPTGPRYSQPHMGTPKDTGGDYTRATGKALSSQPKLLSTPFPKFNPRDVEIFIIEAEAWFMFNWVYDHKSMINHTGSQLEGNARKWWTAKLCINCEWQGRLFQDWQYFTQHLAEQFNPRNPRVEAYNKLLNLCLTSDTPGSATHHVECFRDLEGQVNMEDKELVIDLFRGCLTCGLQEKVTSPISTTVCHWCKGTGHWARDCPSRKSSGPMRPRPNGPKVMVTMESASEEEATNEEEGPAEEEEYESNTADQEGLDLSQHCTQEDEDNGETKGPDNEGNISGAMH